MIETLLDPEIVLTFRDLQEQAYAVGEPDPTAMTLASADRDGRVSLRAVLLKHFDERGFVFYTNLHSHKGRQLSANPRAAINFLWFKIGNQVQVRAEGEIEAVSDADADTYFASRARDSQIGAWASKQSETLPDRATFEQRMDEFRLRFDGQPVPRPAHWSGLRLRPDLIEFWYGARYRLHQRDRWELVDGHWQRRLLYP
ncbi:MAG: pyridoxamine 5'-phosphate oxidase [Lysobacterales bacterium]